MEQQSGILTNRNTFLTVLFVSPLEDDHLSLEAIIGHSAWRLFKASHLHSALEILRQQEISVILCECDLLPGAWTDLLANMKDHPRAPSLIVTSRFADERLWAEALNLGAWDVLAKPFDRAEVLRSVKAAWQHWHNASHMSGAVNRVMRAAS